MLLAHANQLLYSLPLVIVVSLVYAGTRHEAMPAILNHALRIGVWIMVFMLGLGLLLWWLGKGL